jgi:hypothetical protein
VLTRYCQSRLDLLTLARHGVGEPCWTCMGYLTDTCCAFHCTGHLRHITSRLSSRWARQIRARHPPSLHLILSLPNYSSVECAFRFCTRPPLLISQPSSPLHFSLLSCTQLPPRAAPVPLRARPSLPLASCYLSHSLVLGGPAAPDKRYPPSSSSPVPSSLASVPRVEAFPVTTRQHKPLQPRLTYPRLD